MMGTGGELHVLDVLTGRDVFRDATEKVYGLAFCPEGKRLAAGSKDGALYVWDIETGERLLTLNGHACTPQGTFSPDGRFIASACVADRIIRLWDTTSGKLLQQLKGHTDPIWMVTFSPDGERLVSTSRDRTVRVWDVATGQELLVLRGHSKLVQSAKFSPDGRRLVTESWDGTVRVWEAEPIPARGEH
jgi:WD40 repeat protein